MTVQSLPDVSVAMCQHRLHPCADPEEPDPSPQILVEPFNAGSERVSPCRGVSERIVSAMRLLLRSDKNTTTFPSRGSRRRRKPRKCRSSGDAGTVEVSWGTLLSSTELEIERLACRCRPDGSRSRLRSEAGRLGGTRRGERDRVLVDIQTNKKRSRLWHG